MYYIIITIKRGRTLLSQGYRNQREETRRLLSICPYTMAEWLIMVKNEGCYIKEFGYDDSIVITNN